MCSPLHCPFWLVTESIRNVALTRTVFLEASLWNVFPTRFNILFLSASWHPRDVQQAIFINICQRHWCLLIIWVEGEHLSEKSEEGVNFLFVSVVSVVAIFHARSWLLQFTFGVTQKLSSSGTNRVDCLRSDIKTRSVGTVKVHWLTD